MPTNIAVKWENLDRLRTFLERYSMELQKKVEVKLRETAEEIKVEAKRNCPVDTGSLQKSIRIQTYARPAGVMQKIGVSAGGYITNPKTGRLVDYAGHVEYGTSRSPSQPFLRPAFENKKSEIERLMREAVREALLIY